MLRPNFANRKMAWLSAQSGPPTALARVETSHEVEILVKSEEENLAELMFEERARREAEEKKANLAAQIAAAKATMGARVAALLNEKLAKSWQKISSLFRSWDVDGDGWITKREFAKGMGVLGLGVSPDDVDELFAWFDPDNSFIWISASRTGTSFSVGTGGRVAARENFLISN